MISSTVYSVSSDCRSLSRIRGYLASRSYDGKSRTSEPRSRHATKRIPASISVSSASGDSAVNGVLTKSWRGFSE